MGEVTGLFGAHPVVMANGEPDAEVIEALEHWLEQARSGYLRALASCRVYKDRSIAHGWFGHADAHDMLSGVGMLNHRIYQVHYEHQDD
jgi:hypothetical protein